MKISSITRYRFLSFIYIVSSIMALIHACALCLQCKDEVFGPLLDVSHSEVPLMTFNIISMIFPSKLCVECCRELTYVGQLLFKWRKSIILTLECADDSAAAAAAAFKKEEREDLDVYASEERGRDHRANGFDYDDYDDCDPADCDDSQDPDRDSVKRVKLPRNVRVELERVEVRMEGKEQQHEEEEGQQHKVGRRSNGTNRDPDYDPTEEIETRGRPRGCLKKKTTDVKMDERVATAAADAAAAAIAASYCSPEVRKDLIELAGKMKKRKRGRPRGTFKVRPIVQDISKKLDLRMETDEEVLAGQCATYVRNDPNVDPRDEPIIRKRGRPRGSTKTKPTHPNVETNVDESLNLPEKADSYTCHICAKIFKIRKCFVTHVARHSALPQVHTCDQCGRSFKDKFRLKEHLSVHDETPQYKCDQCHKGFNRRGSLRTHKAVHHGDGVKRHVCRLCPKAFLARNSLLGHEKTHTGVKPFQCRLCDKRFYKRSARRNHESTHGDRVKSVPCEICGNLFYNVQQKNEHRKLIHTPPKIPCPHLCGRMFRRNQKAALHGNICAAGRSRGSNHRVTSPEFL